MADNSRKKPREGDDKVAYIEVRGKTATRWRRLLREEGGTEQHHGLSAIEDYIEKKGYDKEPTPSK
jgi:hypothetical protein